MATLLPQNQWFTKQGTEQNKKQINESWIREIEITKLNIDKTNAYKNWTGSVEDDKNKEDIINISAFNLDPDFDLSKDIPKDYIPKIKIIIHNEGYIYLNKDSSYLFSFPKTEEKKDEQILVEEGEIKNFENLEIITGLENLSINIQTKEDNTTTDSPLTLKGAFQGCTSLKSIDLSKIENFELISDITYMFNSCSSIEEISLPTKAFIPKCLFTSFEGLFQGCSSLKVLNEPSKWNTMNITNMKNTFAGCSKLVRLDISQWDVSKVTTFENFLNMNYKVSNSTKNISFKEDTPFIKGAGESPLKINIGLWKISSSCTNLEGAFSGLSNTFFDFSNFDTSEVITMKGMCKNCSKLERVIGLHTIDDSKLENINEMFSGCSNLRALNMTAFGKDRLIKGITKTIPESQLTRNSNKIFCENTLLNCNNLIKLSLGPRFKQIDKEDNKTKIILPGADSWYLLAEESPGKNKTCSQENAYKECPGIFYKTPEAAQAGRDEKVVINRGYLSDIGCAIRSTTKYASDKEKIFLIREMAQAIKNINKTS